MHQAQRCLERPVSDESLPIATENRNGVPKPCDDVPDSSTGLEPLRVIDEPGVYTLESDLSVEEDEVGILILSGDVTLIGAGNSITGNDTGTGIFIDGDLPTEDVAITNVEFADLSRAIDLFETVDCSIFNITAENCGTGVFQSNDARDNTIPNSTFLNSPIQINQSNGTTAVGNTIEGSDGNGVTLFDGGGHTFVRNIISMHDEAGVLINPSSNNIFIRNEITENGTVGIELDDGERNTFIDNLLEDNEDGPCSVDDRSEDNRFEGNDPECE